MCAPFCDKIKYHIKQADAAFKVLKELYIKVHGLGYAPKDMHNDIVGKRRRS